MEHSSLGEPMKAKFCTTLPALLFSGQCQSVNRMSVIPYFHSSLPKTIFATKNCVLEADGNLRSTVSLAGRTTYTTLITDIVYFAFPPTFVGTFRFNIIYLQPVTYQEYSPPISVPGNGTPVHYEWTFQRTQNWLRLRTSFEFNDFGEPGTHWTTRQDTYVP